MVSTLGSSSTPFAIDDLFEGIVQQQQIMRSAQQCPHPCRADFKDRSVLFGGFSEPAGTEHFRGRCQLLLQLVGVPPRRERECHVPAAALSMSGPGTLMRAISDGSNLTSPPA